jgi:hypothetical protein
MDGAQTRNGRAVQAMLLLLSLTAAIAPAAESTSTPPSGAIPYELWDRPRSGRALLAVPAVRDAMAALLARSEARLRIRHPAGVEGVLQAEELRTWLIAHAIEPGRLVLQADPGARQPLQLEILP